LFRRGSLAFPPWRCSRRCWRTIGAALDGRSNPYEWYADHHWALDVDKIAALKEHADRHATPVFLCGVAAGDAEAWRYFDVVCALVIDEATIRARIELRDESWFGKRPEELNQILAWNVGYADTYRGFGAVIVDATNPLPMIVDAVIGATSA
jgi:hypothetical protein